MKLSELTKQQKEIGIAVIVFIVVLILVALFSRESSNKVAPVNETPGNETTTTTPTSTPQAQPAAKPKTPSTAQIDQAAAYASALKKYAGNYIQFNPSCQAIPANVTFKNGTAVMFDNRSTKQITISLDDNKFTIKPFDYLVMKVTSKVLPKTISVSCNSAYNVGQILLQQ